MWPIASRLLELLRSPASGSGVEPGQTLAHWLKDPIASSRADRKPDHRCGRRIHRRDQIAAIIEEKRRMQSAYSEAFQCHPTPAGFCCTAVGRFERAGAVSGRDYEAPIAGALFGTSWTRRCVGSFTRRLDTERVSSGYRPESDH